ncbi:MAG: hypothetical protein QM493_10335 [Sulfurovum sp.]
MKIKIIKACVVNGKSHKPSDKEIIVSSKDGATLISLGKAEDLTPQEEAVAISLNVDVSAFEELNEEIEAKDIIIKELEAKVVSLTTECKEAGVIIKKLEKSKIPLAKKED